MDFQISVSQFRAFSTLIRDQTGMQMQEKKMSLVAGRLARRLRELGCGGYGEYLEMLKGDTAGAEIEVFVDLITTHVTHFFREPDHFRYLGKMLERVEHFPFRVWSAAVSTGEEAYSAALVLQDHLGARRWEILGTDVSAGSVGRARAGVYPLTGAEQIAPYYLKKYCLKGRGSMEGYFTFDDQIRSGVHFDVLNLTDLVSLPSGFSPDVIILRNVMIYFDQIQQQHVLDRVVPLLGKGGILMTGHAESLATFRTGLKLVQTAVYEKL